MKVKVKSTTSYEGFSFLLFSLIPIFLGAIAIFYVIHGYYTDMDWAVIFIVIFIGLIGKGLVEQ